MSEIINFEMASSNDPKDIIMATQRSFVAGLKDLLVDLKKEMNQPGLTWEQLEVVLDSFAKKEPTIIQQQESM